MKQGKRVADSVQFYIQFGSQETREYCIRKGYLDDFPEGGSAVIEPSCGACINAGPGVSHPSGPGGDQRAESQFPRPQRPGADVPGELR